MSDKFKGIRLEFHIIQSFPVSCLNRDDLGMPKSAIIGGVPRARVSSQCWKRAVRMRMHELGVKTANRTRYIIAAIAKKCSDLGASEEQAMQCGEWTAKAFTKTIKNGGISDTLFFLSDSEAEGIAAAFKETDFAEIKDKELQKVCKKSLNPALDGLDIALFGRMVADAPDMNVEAAASFAHAISTHRVDPEIDFFTAVDDCRPEDQTSSAHMGTLEYNSATYYRYISLDLGQLAETLKTDDITQAVEAFTQALFLAVPSARQATMSAASPWDYAIVTLRKGQRIQLPFNTAVKTSAKEPDMVENSINSLKERFEQAKRMYGSLFGLIGQQEISMKSGSVDELTEGLKNAIVSL